MREYDGVGREQSDVVNTRLRLDPESAGKRPAGVPVVAGWRSQGRKLVVFEVSEAPGGSS